jgi:hypothetical protein
MIRISTIAGIYLGVATISLVAASPLWAQEDRCGTVHKLRRQPLDEQRFRPIVEYGGKAFLDLRTCLIGRLEFLDTPVTLSDAMLYCARLGSERGPHGEMGWQLPTMAQLTSLDGKEWQTRRGEFEQSKIPPLNRNEQRFWTSTKWPGTPNSWAVVEYSVRTTLVTPLAETEKARV